MLWPSVGVIPQAGGLVTSWADRSVVKHWSVARHVAHAEVGFDRPNRFPDMGYVTTRTGVLSDSQISVRLGTKPSAFHREDFVSSRLGEFDAYG